MSSKSSQLKLDKEPFFCDYKSAEKYCGDDVDVWYTERNGDPITLVVEKGTPKTDLPRLALGYMVFRWNRVSNS